MAEEAHMDTRGHWGTRLGFILAAAGSAVGLGNLWRYPVKVHENGGGFFVIFYIFCVLLVGLPIMVSEILIGRATQRSPVGAFTALAGRDSAWRAVGWMGVLAGFVILSFYSVVGGWSMNYALLSFFDYTKGKTPEEIEGVFSILVATGDIQVFWHTLFMAVTVGIVMGGIRHGIERWSRILMPALLVILILLIGRSLTLEGASRGLKFVFSFNREAFKPVGALEALGQAFFSLSLGMGAMLTYGSYLDRRKNLVTSSGWICLLDTSVALAACVIIFPIVFSFSITAGREDIYTGGVGLLFQTIPIAFAQMKAGQVLSIIFYALVVFAAVTSAVSLLEVVTSYFIDEVKWSRRRAVLITGACIYLLGIPSALASAERGLFGSKPIFSSWGRIFPENFFGTVDGLSSNWMLPIGGFFIALYVGWFLKREIRWREFSVGGNPRVLYLVWLFCVRFIVPLAVVLVFLNAVNLLPELLPESWMEWLKGPK